MLDFRQGHVIFPISKIIQIDSRAHPSVYLKPTEACLLWTNAAET
jgi:hypothetical protein